MTEKKSDAIKLYNSVLKLQTVEECEKFFEDLCTTKELGAMIQRHEVASLLLDKKIYTETVFDQIWYIRSGLTHADLIKVAEKYANQKILQARDWKALQKKLQGGDRL